MPSCHTCHAEAWTFPALQEILPLVQPNLAAAAQPVRCATLRLLCCFEQPPLPAVKEGAADKETSPAEAGSAAASDLFSVWHRIESQTCSLENGRQVRAFPHLGVQIVSRALP